MATNQIIKKTGELQWVDEEEELSITEPTKQLKTTKELFGEDPRTAMPQPQVATEQPQDKWYTQFGRLYKSFQKGTFGASSRILRALDKASMELAEIGEEKLGIPKEKLRGGIFEKLATDHEYFYDKLEKEGARGIEGEVLSGLGGAAIDIPAIMTFGKYGLPIHGGLLGAAEGGKKGAVEGTLRGLLTHKVIQGIGMLPSITRLPAWATFGAVSTPGGIEEKTAGGITWTVLGMSGGSKKLSMREFIENYPKIAKRVGDRQATFMLKKLAPEVTPEEIKEAGGARIVLDQVIIELDKLPKPKLTPKTATPEQLKARMKQIEQETLDAPTEAKSELRGQWLELNKQLGISEKPLKKTEELKFEPLEEIVEKRIKSYPGFPKDAPDIWHSIMERGGIKRPKLEVEEFEGNVPKQLRRGEGLAPDDMAARLGLEDVNELYRLLEPMRAGVEREAEKPPGMLRLEHEEFLDREPQQQLFIKTEADILKKTGYENKEIEEFIEHQFLDGKELRATVEDVISGKVKSSDAVVEIKGLIKSVTGKEPPKLKPVEQKPIEELIEETPTQKELETEGTNRSIVGLPLFKAGRTAVEKIIDTLQVEPQFRRVGAPDTGLAFKTFHSKVNGELIRTERTIKDLTKMKLGKDEYQELTFVSARPGKFYAMEKEKQKKFSPAYQKVRDFFDHYAGKLKERGIIIEVWPQSAINRMMETKEANIKALNRVDFDPAKEAKLQKEIKDIDVAVDFLKKTKAQYVHVPRTWMEVFWADKRGEAPTVISEFFKTRKVYDIEALAKWLVKEKHIKPQDTDIRIIMAEYAHKVSKKIALSDILTSAKREGLIKGQAEAPDTWQFMDRKMFPTLKGQKAHPMFTDFMEKNLTARKFLPLKMGRILGTIKMLQFYNPLFLPMYDVVQAWWAGSVRSRKTISPTIKK